MTFGIFYVDEFFFRGRKKIAEIRLVKAKSSAVLRNESQFRDCGRKIIATVAAAISKRLFPHRLLRCLLSC